MLLSRRLGMPLPRSIAVVRMLRGLGDMLCAVPALRSLRRALPEARITLVGLHSADTFVKRFSHYVDELAEFPGYPGLPEKEPHVEQMPEFLSIMHSHRFDLAIQMHGNGTITNPFTALLHARVNAGFYVPGQFCPDTNHFLHYIERESEVLRYLRLMEFLGVPPAGAALEFPLWKHDRHELAGLPEIRDLWPRGYICIHPGAHDPSRCWPVEKFALLADALSDHGLPLVFTGDATERGLTRRISKLMKNDSFDLAGRMSLGALGVLLSNARLLVCNDTGISHMAAALQVPSVVIFTKSDPERWAPLDANLHRIVTAGKGANNGSIASPRARTSGIKSVHDGCLPDPQDVLAAAEDLLMQEKVYWQCR